MSFEEISPEVLSNAEFSLMIEKHADTEGIPLVNAILEVCEKYDIDMEHIKNMVTPNFKEKLAMSEHITTSVYGKTTKLPIDDDELPLF